MGRKSRAKIEDEFNREQYFRYLKMLRDPEFKDLWEELNKINEKLKANPNDVNLWPKKESIEKQLRNKYGLAIVDIPYSIWTSLTEEERKCLELPINPLKPLKREEFENFPDFIFLDMDIVEPIPFKQPKLIPNLQNSQRSKLDFTDYLRPDPQIGKPRYLQIKIDTWNKGERIFTALKEKLEFLQNLEVIKFKSRLRLSTDEERIRIRELRDRGILEKEIARFLWPEEYDKEEARIAEIEDLENKKAILRNNYIRKLYDQGGKFSEAPKKARKKYPPKKLPVNRLTKKVKRLLSEIPK